MTIDQIVSKLKGLNEPIFGNRDWPSYQEIGFGENEVEALLDLASAFYLEVEQSDEESAVSIHAWRALAVMGSREILPDILSLSIACNDIEDEWFADEFPSLLGLMGMEVLPELLDAVRSSPDSPCLAEGLIEGLPLMVRDEADRVQALETLVGLFGEIDGNRYLGALVVASLVDLKAVEKIEEVRSQFAVNAIDVMMAGDLEEVELALGLRKERSTPRPDFEKEEARLTSKKQKELAGDFPKEGSLEEQLQYFLIRYGTERSLTRIDELDGYLLALVLSGQELSITKISEWVWEVGGGKGVVSMEADWEEKVWLACLQQFFQKVEEGLRAGDYQPHVSIWPDAEDSMDPEAPFFTPWLEGLMAGESDFTPSGQLSAKEENARLHFAALVHQVLESEEEGIRLLEDQLDNPIYPLMELIEARYAIRSRGSGLRRGRS